MPKSRRRKSTTPSYGENYTRFELQMAVFKHLSGQRGGLHEMDTSVI